MHRFCLIVVAFVAAVHAQPSAAAEITRHERIVGACEGCEAVFQGLPATLEAATRLGEPSEPGEPLMLSGVVKDARGAPQAGVVVYAYQTDSGGHYPRAPQLTGEAARHGRLRGWARTDAAGRYTFRTIRPGAYPGRSIPQHVHMHVIEPGRCTYYLGDVLFDDDPLLTAALRERERDARGGNGIVRPARDGNGWTATRDVVLGANVAEYAECTAKQ